MTLKAPKSKKKYSHKSRWFTNYVKVNAYFTDHEKIENQVPEDGKNIDSRITGKINLHSRFTQSKNAHSRVTKKSIGDPLYSAVQNNLRFAWLNTLWLVWKKGRHAFVWPIRYKTNRHKVFPRFALLTWFRPCWYWLTVALTFVVIGLV